jgi:hypothetical protein
MIADRAHWRRWEAEYIRQESVDVDRNLRLYEALYVQARQMGVFSAADLLEGVPRKTRLARCFMFRDLLEKMAKAFEARSIAYMVIGGQAALLYGEPRLTADVDVTVGIAPEGLPVVLEAVRALGWQVLVEDAEAFVRRTMVLPCREEASGIRIDIVFSQSAYEQEALRRVRRVPFGATEVCFASPEYVIIHEVIAGRPRDIEDCRRIWLKNPHLDEGYIRHWLQQFEDALGEPFLSRLEQVRQTER